MKTTKYSLWVVLSFLVPISSFAGIEFDNVYLYLPDDAMQERIHNREEFVTYVASFPKEIETAFSEVKSDVSASLAIIVAVRPPNETKVWFDILSGKLTPEDKRTVAKYLEGLDAPEVKDGIVPFAYCIRIGGATEQMSDLPMADEWTAYIDGNTEITKLISRAWKDENKK